jgi:hypothetical protein
MCSGAVIPACAHHGASSVPPGVVRVAPGTPSEYKGQGGNRKFAAPLCLAFHYSPGPFLSLPIYSSLLFLTFHCMLVLNSLTRRPLPSTIHTCSHFVTTFITTQMYSSGPQSNTIQSASPAAPTMRCVLTTQHVPQCKPVRPFNCVQNGIMKHVIQNGILRHVVQNANYSYSQNSWRSRVLITKRHPQPSNLRGPYLDNNALEPCKPIYHSNRLINPEGAPASDL